MYSSPRSRSSRRLGQLLLASAVCLPGASAVVFGAPAKPVQKALLHYPDATGTIGTEAIAGKPDSTLPFFQSLGTNGRSCGTCHDPTAGWSINPALVQARFQSSNGTDPLFRTNDGSTSPLADVSTVEARQTAYSMLLTKGLIRVGIGIPAGAEFALDAVDDPYGYASASELSLFRRPLPAANLRFSSNVMWDGRETKPGQTATQNLVSQAQDAQQGHAQGAPLSDSVVNQIVAFEQGLFTAQLTDRIAGSLTGSGAKGGPQRLSMLQPPGQDTFTPGFDLFTHWSTKKGKLGSRGGAQGSIARGEALFNTLQFNIRDVRGLNDVLGQPIIRGTCSTCHNVPDAGGSTLGLMDLGVGEVVLRRTPDEPLYTLRNLTTQETFSLADPGQALITGKWDDIGKFKVPTLRGLAARPPYFHNGSAVDLISVLNFYDRRFGIGLNPAQVEDISAFLNAL
jgi:cytochrome c peroxidase